jgi:hypothetical protein
MGRATANRPTVVPHGPLRRKFTRPTQLYGWILHVHSSFSAQRRHHHHQPSYLYIYWASSRRPSQLLPIRAAVSQLPTVPHRATLPVSPARQPAKKEGGEPGKEARSQSSRRSVPVPSPPFPLRRGGADARGSRAQRGDAATCAEGAGWGAAPPARPRSRVRLRPRPRRQLPRPPPRGLRYVPTPPSPPLSLPLTHIQAGRARWDGRARSSSDLALCTCPLDSAVSNLRGIFCE